MEESHLKQSLGQFSLEYLLVVALTFAIIVPTTYLFYSYSKESIEEITDAQVTELGKTIVDTAAVIFYSGQGSKTTLELNVPDNIASAVIINGRELVFNVTTNFGVSEIVFFSSVNITPIQQSCEVIGITYVCKMPELASSGLKNVRIVSINKDNVGIEVI